MGYRRNTDTYKRTYGILKQGELLLPMIFKGNLYQTNKRQLVLGLGQSYGIYNLETENWDVPLKYTSIQPLGKNIYTAKDGAYAGIIDGNDNVIVPFDWYSISQVSGIENYLLITNFAKPIRFMGIYNVLSGKFTVEPKYRSITKLSGENYFKVQNINNEYNIIDIQDEPRFKTWYTEITVAQFDDILGESQNIILAKNKGKFGLYNLLSKTQVLPYEYDQITLDQKGYYAFKGNELYLISGRGKVKITKL